uniref:Large ribosomal subunit protein mL46 n=1 Tax=Callorhinchus milii TaxID=7868 RepID=A0A4W3IZ46_CALMI
QGFALPGIELRSLACKASALTTELQDSIYPMGFNFANYVIGCKCGRGVSVIGCKCGRKSLYSDHELRVFKDEERVRRRLADDYDSDEEEVVGQEIVSAQDLEDSWDQKLKKFSPAKRNDRLSLNRKLEDKLILLVKERLGDEELWLLPQGEWKPWESLRRTAERTLSLLCLSAGDKLRACFLGKAPSGLYKYRYPITLRSSGYEGAKVFFFKAMLTNGDLQTDVKDHVWVTKSELQHYLKPQYLKQLNRFVFDF